MLFVWGPSEEVTALYLLLLSSGHPPIAHYLAIKLNSFVILC